MHCWIGLLGPRGEGPRGEGPSPEADCEAAVAGYALAVQIAISGVICPRSYRGSRPYGRPGRPGALRLVPSLHWVKVPSCRLEPMRSISISLPGASSPRCQIIVKSPLVALVR